MKPWRLVKRAAIWSAILLAGDPSLVALGQQPASPKAAPDRFYLRRDAQLRAKLSVEGMNPAVQEILDRLRDATQLNLTLDASLRYHSPVLGSMQLRDAPAFAVMELLAERQIEDGYWEKTKDGYRLTGKSLALRPPPTALTAGKLAAFGGGGVLVVLAAAAVVYARRRTTAPTKATAAPPAPTTTPRPTGR